LSNSDALSNAQEQVPRIVIEFLAGRALDAAMLHRWTIIIALLLPLLTAAESRVPAELAAALDSFRAEGSWGWGFTQHTAAEGKSLLERYDPRLPDGERWTLLAKNGAEPSVRDLTEYREKQSRRTGGLNAPNVKDQLNRESVEAVSDDGERAAWRFRLVPGGPDDSSARHMAATFTLHRPTATVEKVELASFEPFSPVFGVRISEARTVMRYSLPEGDRPTLLQEVSMRVRGRAMWLKSLDSDLTVSFEDHFFGGRASSE